MTGGDTFLLSLPETHLRNAAFRAAQPDGKAAFLCKKNAAKRPRPRRGARRENREHTPAFRKCVCVCSRARARACGFRAPVRAKPRPVPEGGRCVRCGAKAGHVPPLRKAPEGRVRRGRGNRVTSGRKLRPLRII